MVDYLQGAGMVWYPGPPRPRKSLYDSNDVIALVSDMAAVGGDLKCALKRMDEYVGKR
ncbi:MAG: hypothetical protein WCK65_03875 [Rhodospirillaceae bacterium]